MMGTIGWHAWVELKGPFLYCMIETEPTLVNIYSFF